MKRRYSLLAFVLILFLSDCATVPVTGRRQLNLVSNQEIISLSAQEYNKVLASNQVITGTNQAQMVKRVGERIQKAVDRFMADKGMSDALRGYQWEFNLLKDDDMVNAWAMPGGKVAFYTGILPICEDENGVAVVMGHEVAHAVANHGRERMSQGLVANLGLSTISAAMGQNPGLTEQIFMQSVGMGTQLGMLKFSREHESEADEIGLIFMAMAGYDPREAIDFWQRMAKLSEGQAPPEFLSTHPSNETRIADIRSDLPEAMEYYRP